MGRECCMVASDQTIPGEYAQSLSCAGRLTSVGIDLPLRFADHNRIGTTIRFHLGPSASAEVLWGPANARRAEPLARASTAMTIKSIAQNGWVKYRLPDVCEPITCWTNSNPSQRKLGSFRVR